ncbi:UNVERIFIED_CONTAM: hypothetical protein H355_002049, partial [Colinus virginianus]
AWSESSSLMGLPLALLCLPVCVGVGWEKVLGYLSVFLVDLCCQTSLCACSVDLHPTAMSCYDLCRPCGPVSYTHLDVYKRQIVVSWDYSQQWTEGKGKQ